MISTRIIDSFYQWQFSNHYICENLSEEEQLTLYCLSKFINQVSYMNYRCFCNALAEIKNFNPTLLINLKLIDKGNYNYIFTNDNLPGHIIRIYCANNIRDISNQVRDVSLLIQEMKPKFIISPLKQFITNSCIASINPVVSILDDKIDNFGDARKLIHSLTQLIFFCEKHDLYWVDFDNSNFGKDSNGNIILTDIDIYIKPSKFPYIVDIESEENREIITKILEEQESQKEKEIRVLKDDNLLYCLLKAVVISSDKYNLYQRFLRLYLRYCVINFWQKFILEQKLDYEEECQLYGRKTIINKDFIDLINSIDYTHPLNNLSYRNIKKIMPKLFYTKTGEETKNITEAYLPSRDCYNQSIIHIFNLHFCRHEIQIRDILNNKF